MLWYKDKTSWLQRIKNYNPSIKECILYGLAIALTGFIIGYGYQSLVNAIVRHCVW